MGDIWKPELKLYAMRKSRDGTIISFVLHPDDHSEALNRAPIGTRFKGAFVQLAEETDEPAEPKIKRTSLAQIAGIICGDPLFRQFIIDKYQHIIAGVEDWTPVGALYLICGVDSRKEFDTDPRAAARFVMLKGAFEQWSA